MYVETVRPDKAEKAFQRILDHDPSLGKISAGLEGYAMVQMATSLDRQRGRRGEALECLKRLVARRDLQATYWAGCGVSVALFTYNQTQDPKQSLPLYGAMLKKHPDHPMAEPAHFSDHCLDAIQLKNAALAEKASQAFFTNYPKSEYRSLLEKKMGSLAQGLGKTNTSR